MAVRNILRGLSGSAASEAAAAAAAPADPARRLEVLDDFEQAGIGWIWASDGDGRMIYLSPGAFEKTGLEPADLIGQPLAALFEIDADNPDEKSDRPLNFQLNSRSKIHDLTVRMTYARATMQGRRTWWSVSGHPKFDKAGKFCGYRGSAKDVTQEYERKLVDSRMAEYDALTGLSNRHRINRRLVGRQDALEPAVDAVAVR